MTSNTKWYFSKQRLSETESRKHGYSADRELSCRQDAASFIFDAGVKLNLTYGCINTATMYMHRFYVYHSFSNFQRHNLGAAALYLAAKIMDQPRKIEYIVKTVRYLLHKDKNQIDKESPRFEEEQRDLIINEEALMLTLGFELDVLLPHPVIIQMCSAMEKKLQGPKEKCKEMFELAYSIAHCCINLTMLCLEYSQDTIACLCIFIACKWSNSSSFLTEYLPIFKSRDARLTPEKLEELTVEFVTTMRKCPEDRRNKILSLNKGIGSREVKSPTSNGSMSSYTTSIISNRLSQTPSSWKYSSPITSGRPSGTFVPPPTLTVLPPATKTSFTSALSLSYKTDKALTKNQSSSKLISQPCDTISHSLPNFETSCFVNDSVEMTQVYLSDSIEVCSEEAVVTLTPTKHTPQSLKIRIPRDKIGPINADMEETQQPNLKRPHDYELPQYGKRIK